MTDKETPAKPRVDDDDWLCCRRCNETFSLTNGLHQRNKYCGNCGQKIDWSDFNKPTTVEDIEKEYWRNQK